MEWKKEALKERWKSYVDTREIIAEKKPYGCQHTSHKTKVLRGVQRERLTFRHM